MSRVENSPKINKRGGGGWKSYPIINKRASPYIRQVRVDSKKNCRIMLKIFLFYTPQKVEVKSQNDTKES